MAYKKRDTWYIYATGPDGKKVPKATTARTAKEADRLKEKLDREAREAAAEQARRDALGEITWAGLLDWYCQEEGKHLKSQTIFGTVDKHVRPALGEVSVFDRPADRFEGLLNSLRDELAPATLNRLRTAVYSAFALGVRRNRIPKPNPIEDVKTYAVGKVSRVLLDEDEVPRMFAEIPERWRAVFAIELMFAARKGEVLGIEVANVDTANWEITFERGKTDDVLRLRVPEQLRPYILDALEAAKASGSRYLFPKADGTRYLPGQLDLVGILRTALVKAKIVTAWSNKCRRKGCGFVEERVAEESRRPCPTCGFALWPVGHPKLVTFRGIRAIVVTIADRQGASLGWLQDLLGHASPSTTKRHYVTGDSRVSERVASILPYTLERRVALAATGTDATGALPEEAGEKDEPPGAASSAADPGGQVVGPIGFEPTTSSVSRALAQWQRAASRGISSENAVQGGAADGYGSGPVVPFGAEIGADATQNATGLDSPATQSLSGRRRTAGQSFHSPPIPLRRFAPIALGMMLRAAPEIRLGAA